MKHSNSRLVSPALQHEIEQFLFVEANLLDTRQFEEWCTLLAGDLRYFMPLRSNLDTASRDGEFSGDNESAYFDDTKEYMQMRVRRLLTERAWAEEPPSRTRHMISNVRISPLDGERGLEVRSVFFVYRSRLERQVDEYVGERVDVLRKADNPYGWELAKRTIYLDQATLLSANLSIFF
jgi:3-phenylpropionate/cinnamic acid dioxygenase small subunit